MAGLPRGVMLALTGRKTESLEEREDNESQGSHTQVVQKSQFKNRNLNVGLYHCTTALAKHDRAGNQDPQTESETEAKAAQGWGRTT